MGKEKKRENNNNKQQQSKPAKKKKMKKWKERKVRAEPEWPSFGGAKSTSSNGHATHVSPAPSPTSKRPSIASLLKGMETEESFSVSMSTVSEVRDDVHVHAPLMESVRHDHQDEDDWNVPISSNGHGIRRRMISSELRFKMLMRSEN